MRPFKVLILWSLLAAGSAHAAPSDLGDADDQPGRLRLPLTVVERSGVDRRGVVVTGGVPFPAGFLPDASRLHVVDASGRAVPSQASVMTRWWKPRYDNSVRWALVSFQADVAAGGTATYYLTDASSSPPSPRLRVESTSEAIVVSTGRAEFAVPRSGTSLLGRATVDGRNVLGPAGLRGIITSAKWDDQGLAGGETMTATFAPDLSVPANTRPIPIRPT